MKLSTEYLNAALTTIGPAVDRNPTIDILRCVKLVADGECLTVTGTNTEIEINLSVHAQIEEPGSVCIDYGKLATIAKNAPPGTTTMKLGKNQLSIKTPVSSHRLNKIDAENFPYLPHLETVTVTVDAAIFAQHIARTIHCCAQNDVRAYLNGILLTAENKSLNFAASNGHQVGHSSLDLQTEDSTHCILPVNSAQAIIKTFKTGNIDLAISSDLVQATSQQVSIITRCITGTYPDVSAYFTRQRDRSAGINANDLAGVIASAAPTTGEHGKMHFDLNGGTLTVRSDDGTGQESVATCECGHDGEPIKSAYNNQYVLAAAKQIDGPAVLEFGDIGDPMLVRPKTGDFAYLIMPMH